VTAIASGSSHLMALSVIRTAYVVAAALVAATSTLHTTKLIELAVVAVSVIMHGFNSQQAVSVPDHQCVPSDNSGWFCV
jgi:predicted tellurium resistance membrane protein TerC